jgi:YrbI family 3-deoxy-D-manno-octulosonate 8-phosphate phosphatase
MNIAAFIPAKGSSERVKSKNSQEILGVPLFLWAANNLNRVLPKDKIYIDSNSDDILELAKSHGFNTIKRSEDLSTNATDGNQLMLWQASQVEADVYIQHLPPMVFLKEETIRQGIEKIAAGYDSAFAVAKKQMYLWNEKGPVYDLRNLPNSKTLPVTISEGMGFYITTRESLLESRLRIGEKYAMVGIDNFEEMDIDYPEDLEFARTIARGLGFHSPYTDGIQDLRIPQDIRFLVLDIDGVLTDAGMYYTESGDEFKKFNAKDGMVIKKLPQQGIEVGFLSSGFKTGLIGRRAELLGVKHVHVGTGKKIDILNGWLKKMNLSLQQVAYVGDDINDIDVIKAVGFSACPADAVQEVQELVDVVLDRVGGNACVRELAERFLIKH